MTDESADARVHALVHDLRTPLALVLGFSELLETRGSELSDEQRADFLARIAEAAKELGRLLDAV